MSEIKSVIPKVAEDVFGKEGKYIAEAAICIVEITRNVKKVKEEKLKALSVKEYDMSYLYNEMILENFISRNFQYYGSERKISMRKIKDEVENKKYFKRNVIITGQAGVGKTTVLKWLFLNSNIPECKYMFIYAKMFEDCESLSEVLARLENIIPNDKSCAVFFDGLDELKCINGNEYEFNTFINYFDRKSKYDVKKPDCKFVISTRPEHFEFNNNIIKRNSDISIDNYAVFELLTLTKKEAFKICKSIKKFYQFDEEKHLENYKKKWPSNNTGEVEYLKNLNNYLDNVDMNCSLLNIPLFCRYAYPIISVWRLQEEVYTSHNDMTQSERIENVLESYIKWEFHDSYRYQAGGENSKGKKLLDKYINQVFDFLTELVSLMKNNESISRKSWEELRSAKDININAALCALQEDNSGNIKFIHNTFRNYFLARYYASSQNKNEEGKNLSILLRRNLEFCILYVEQMANSSNEIVRKIYDYLLNQKDMDMEKLSEYANGNISLIYKPSITFTIEEYLSVFPDGTFMYAGINFNKFILNNLKSNGILKILNVNYLAGFNQQVISKNMYVKGMQFNSVISHRYFLLFYIYEFSDLKFLDGYFHASETYKKQVAALLSKAKGSFETITDKENIKAVLELIDDYKNRYLEYEEERFKNMSIRMIEFMGIDNNYWCLMNEDSIYIYMMIPENEKVMSDLFIKGKAKYPNAYSTAYGDYRARTLNMETIIQMGYNYAIDSLSFVFNAEQFTLIKSNDFFINYYSTHYTNISLLKKRMADSSIFLYEDISNDVSIHKIFKWYESMEEFLEKSGNEKLQLYYSDEKLLTLYTLGKGEEMVSLAQNTYSLCEHYQHIHGLKLREFLLRDDMSFIGDDLKKVYEYSEKYIWI